jgi:hypothetical protein
MALFLQRMRQRARAAADNRQLQTAEPRALTL